MKRVAVVVLLLAVIGVAAWLLWSSAGSLGVDDVAGVYHFDPRPDIQALEPERGNVGEEQLSQAVKYALRTGELTLHPDFSATTNLNLQGIESSRWALRDGRVFIYFKTRGRSERPVPRGGCLVRDGTLVIGFDDKPLVLRKQ